MPLYQYRCISGHSTEELRKLDDRRTYGVCSTCKQETPTRLIMSPVCPPKFGIGIKGHYSTQAGEYSKPATRGTA